MGMVFCPADYTSNSDTGFSLLFKSWVISSDRSYYLACIGVVAMGVARQLCVSLRMALNKGYFLKRKVSGRLLEREEEEERGFQVQQPLAVVFLDTFLYALVLFLAYLNMLVAMAYDFGLLFSLVLGEALTYGVVRVVLRSRGDLQPPSPAEDERCCSS